MRKLADILADIDIVLGDSTDGNGVPYPDAHYAGTPMKLLRRSSRAVYVFPDMPYVVKVEWGATIDQAWREYHAWHTQIRRKSVNKRWFAATHALMVQSMQPPAFWEPWDVYDRFDVAVSLQERVFDDGEHDPVCDDDAGECVNAVRKLFPQWSDWGSYQCVYDADRGHYRCVDYAHVTGRESPAYSWVASEILPKVRMGEKVLVTGGVDSVRSLGN